VLTLQKPEELQLEQRRNYHQPTTRSSNQANSPVLVEDGMKNWKGTKLGTISKFTLLLPIASIEKMQGEKIGAQAYSNAAVTQTSEDDLAEQALVRKSMHRRACAHGRV
jgi:hypothetical protein